MEQNTNACLETELRFWDQWIIKYFLLCNATSNELKIAEEKTWEIHRTCIAALFPTGLTSSCITWKNPSTLAFLKKVIKEQVFTKLNKPLQKGIPLNVSQCSSFNTFSDFHTNDYWSLRRAEKRWPMTLLPNQSSFLLQEDEICPTKPSHYKDPMIKGSESLLTI